MRGRKPKPTALKNLHGHPGKRRPNPNEPKPEGDLREPPSWLTESQRQGWAYALAHAPRGVLRRIDRGVLAVWVVAEDLHRQASERLAKTRSLLVKPPSSELPIQSPYLPILNRQAQVMMKAAEQLGFSPAARPRLAVYEPPRSDDDTTETKPETGDGEDLDAYLARNPSRVH